MRSPRLWKRGQVHLAYSNQIAQGRGAITGGLTDFSPPSGYFPLDHDQRNTLNVGFTANLPWNSYASTNVYYGSGFLDGEVMPGPAYLPGHTDFRYRAWEKFWRAVFRLVERIKCRQSPSFDRQQPYTSGARNALC